MSNPSSSLHNSDLQTPPATATLTTATADAAVNPNFSVITQTIGRQLHNFASFLAPPPQHPYSPSSSVPYDLSGDVSGDVSSDVSAYAYKGLKNDLDEIGDSLKKAVTGISKFASNLLQFDRQQIDVVEVTDDVVDFVRNVSIRHELWVDFPLSLHNKEFKMSRAQKDHVFTMLKLVPNLAALRRKVQDFMSEQQFWMIYFVLLVPRLNEDDCRLLSSPEILHMHEALVLKLRNKAESSGVSDNATNVIKTKTREDDVCFSEVEDEEFKQTQSSRVSSASENSDWVRISGTLKASRSVYRGRRSESEGSSSDWHAVDDVDL
ncbi:hypothetical protein QVD17_29717 [Tagetes erecta]|uniref:BSD domain-containing protein n=1 Tax=Tagetes erecta TaxID=13708 RepID=A0AAD8K6H5_TARER|nr:hypothetical protein QVD17_29717 [Tagetes erecta]